MQLYVLHLEKDSCFVLSQIILASSASIRVKEEKQEKHSSAFREGHFLACLAS